MNNGGLSVPATHWLNRTVLGIGLASLLSDWSHEMATAIMPAFLATMGAAAAWLGVIEGVSDGLSSFAKMGSGYFTDQLRRRKPIAVAGYIVTTVSTACIGLATQAWHVLLCRASAWLGRGLRTPVRKALLAAAVTPETYGRAFGFERMMDTCGAIVGPVSATALLGTFGGDFSRVLLVTLIPGLLAAAAIAFLVEEKERIAVKYISFRARLTALPKPFQRFLLAVALFGSGDFAHSMLILLAAQKLAPQLGATKAAGVAVSLYVLHNVLYAGFAFVAGWLADHFNKGTLLTVGYGLAAVMGLVLVLAPMNPTRSGVNLAVLALVFILAGIYVATEEALEDSLAAELVDKEHHGMGFGMLATVNGIGDFVSSIVVGALWTAWGTQVAFAYSTALFAAGTVAVWRLRDA
jgi:MFS family permease